MLQSLKDKGNKLAKDGKWSEAMLKYSKAIDIIDSHTEIDLQAVPNFPQSIK